MTVKNNVLLHALYLLSSCVSPGMGLSQSPTLFAATNQQHEPLKIYDAPLDFVPIVTVGPGDPRTLSLVLRNDMQHSISYIPGPAHGLAWLNMYLIAADGTNIYYAIMIDWQANPEDLITLKPGESIPLQVSLDDFGLNGRRGNIPPGRYELRAQSSGIAKYGSTPIRIDRTVMMIEIVDGPRSASVGGSMFSPTIAFCLGSVAGVVVVVVCCIALIRCRRVYLAEVKPPK